MEHIVCLLWRSTWPCQLSQSEAFVDNSPAKGVKTAPVLSTTAEPSCSANWRSDVSGICQGLASCHTSLQLHALQLCHFHNTFVRSLYTQGLPSCEDASCRGLLGSSLTSVQAYCLRFSRAVQERSECCSSKSPSTGERRALQKHNVAPAGCKQAGLSAVTATAAVSAARRSFR